MHSVPPTTTILAIQVYARWLGFASPPLRAQKLSIRREPNGEFRRRVEPRQKKFKVELVTDEAIAALRAAVRRPAVSELDPSLFVGLPAEVVSSHFRSRWTDDHPSLLIRVELESGDAVTIRSESQHAFMLPLQVEAFGRRYSTFDPAISRAIVSLLPEGFLNRATLAGESGMLLWHVREYQRRTTGETPASGKPAGNSRERRAAQEDPSQRLLRHVSLTEARSLIAAGASPNVADDSGQTALMRAAYPPFNPELFGLLVDAGADVEARRYDGFTGLHLACSGGEHRAAKAWVDAGADVSSLTPNGETPLMLAAYWPRIVPTLLAAGADIHSADHEGDTALHYAVAGPGGVGGEGQLRAVRLLLEAGADALRTNQTGETPLDVARFRLAETLTVLEVDGALQPADADTELLQRRRDHREQEHRLREEIVTVLEDFGSG